MLVQGKAHQTLEYDKGSGKVYIIDQRYLPYKWVMEELQSAGDVFTAIQDMHVRGAPLIGVTAAFGLFLEMRRNPVLKMEDLKELGDYLITARPTAVNLAWAVQRMLRNVQEAGETIDSNLLLNEALAIRDESIQECRRIGDYGLDIIREIYGRKQGKPVQILTHCNAGWLACVDYGTATAPLYRAQENDIPLHVWVDETRPRNQGARITAWELQQQGIPCSVITDNAGGHLMQMGQVDMVIIGADCVARNGDVVNKIGSYLKALAAKDNRIPFWVAFPSSTFDIHMEEGKQIPIEERDGNEVRFIEGMGTKEIMKVRLTPLGTPVSNPGFDVTPAGLITGYITERGIFTKENLEKGCT